MVPDLAHGRTSFALQDREVLGATGTKFQYPSQRQKPIVGLGLLGHSFISTLLCSDCKEEGGRPQNFRTNDANVPDSELRRAPHRVPYGSGVEAPDVIALVYCMPAQALQLVCCTAFADHDAALSAAQSVGEIVLHEAFSQACGIIKGFDDVVPAGSKYRSAGNQQRQGPVIEQHHCSKDGFLSQFCC